MATLDTSSSRAQRFPIGWSLKMEDLRRDPIGIPTRLREEEPVTWCPDGHCWFVATRALADEVVRDLERFTADFDHSQERMVLGRTMLTTDGPAHSRHRSPFDATLRAGHVRRNYHDIIDRHVHELLDGLSGNRGDLMAQLAEPVGLRVVRDVLGFDFPDDRALKDLVHQLLMAMRTEAGPDVRASASAAREAFAPDVLRALDVARTEAPHTVLGTVARHRTSDLTDELIVNNIVNLIFGGTDTTATIVSTSLWTLLSHPDTLAEVRADRDLIGPAVREAIRRHPTFGLMVRAARKDTRIGGVEIKAGEEIHPLLVAANRDPAAFVEPDRFDIHRRDDKKSLSFGFGVHFCIGQNIAKLTAERAVDACLDRLEGLRLDPDRPSQPTGFEAHKLPRLDVEWDAVRARATR